MLRFLICFLLIGSAVVFGQSPSITRQPANCYAAVGVSCTLTVAASGPNLSYQWYHNESGDTSVPSTTEGYNTCCHTIKVVAGPTCRWVQVSNSSGFANSQVACAEAPPATNAACTAPTYNGPSYAHIVIVVEENHDYGQIIGNTDNAPYINSVLVAGGANFTQYQSVTHPSQPNYLAIYSGSTHGVTDDGTYTEPDPSLYTVLHAAGRSFIGFVDSGSPQKHNPWESFPEGASVEQAFSTFPTTPAGFAALPSVSWVSPNLTDDMHDGTILQGDTWLKNNLGAYAAWAKANNSLLIVTFDEGSGSGANVSSVIPTIYYGAGIVTGNYGDVYNDYSTNKTILSAFGLEAPNLAATAVPVNGSVF